MSVPMYGPAFDGSGIIVNRQVPAADVVAFEKAGYATGTVPDAPHVKFGESVVAKVEEPIEIPKVKGK